MPKMWILVGKDDPLYNRMEDTLTEIKKHLKPGNFDARFSVLVLENQINIYVDVKEAESY